MTAWLGIVDTVEAFHDMTVSGVVRKYRYVPASVDLSGGYCAFIRFGDNTRGAQISTCVNESKSHSLQYVVIIKGAGQGTPEENTEDILALIDTLSTALDGLAPATFNFIDYDVSWSGNYLVGDSGYWAVIADITVSNR